MWGSVDASTHDTFNRCELGLFSYTTLSGGGTWNGVYGISLDHCTIKIANLFGSKLGRMEYVSISEGANDYSISNLTVGALFGSSSKVLTIALTDLASYQIASVYEKKIDFANETVNNLRGLIYTWAKYSVAENIVDYGAVRGTISSVDGTVTWTAMNSIGEKIQAVYDGLFNTKMAKQNPTGTGSISMNSGTASGMNSYANGSGATASGMFSRAIGFGAQASGSYSTAINGDVSGDYSLAFGNQCNAKGDNQVVTGKFNIPDTSSLEIIGNGTFSNTGNARLLDADGNEYLKGDIYVNSTFTKDANGDLDTKSGTKLVAVSANPTLAGTESALTGIEVDGIKYKVGGGGGKLYQHCVFMRGNIDAIYSAWIVLYRSTSTPLTSRDLAVKNHYYNVTGTSRNGNCLIYGFYIENNLTFNFQYKTIVDGAFQDNNSILSNFTLFIDTVTEV